MHQPVACLLFPEYRRRVLGLLLPRAKEALHGREVARRTGLPAGLSAKNRFDAAHKAIMQLSMVALQADGYRTLTSKPGHDQTAIQTLTTSVGVAPARVIVLEALRRQRNPCDCSGDLIPDAVAAECLTSSQALQGHVLAWRTAHRPDLLAG